MRIRSTTALLALALFAPAVARAEPTSAEIAVARKMFREASALEKQKDYAHAADKLKQALAIKETPGLRYHLAFCEEQQGQLVAALVDYDRADEMIADGTKAPDVQALLAPARDALRKRVPTLTVAVAGGVDGAALSIDGKAMAAAMFGQPTPLNPGKHHVQVTAPGYKPFDKDVTLAEGDRANETAALVAVPAAAAPTAPAPAATPDRAPPADAGKGLSTRTIVIGAEAVVTLAALGVGIGYTVAKGSAQSRADDAQAAINRVSTTNDACANPTTELASPCSDLVTALDDKQSAGNLATVGFIGAGVGAAATVATFLLWKPAKSTTTVSVAPLPGGGFSGSVAGTF